MEKKDRRRFSRVNLQWAARLDFGAVEYKRFVNNVSLSGLYIEGDFQQKIGDLCAISLKQSCLFVEDDIRAVGIIARISEYGMAVEFLSMKLDSFFFLQVMLFSKAIDQAALGREFIFSNIFELEGDLIVFKPSFGKIWPQCLQESQDTGSAHFDETDSSRLIHFLQRHSSAPPREYLVHSSGGQQPHQNAQEFLSLVHTQQQL